MSPSRIAEDVVGPEHAPNATYALFGQDVSLSRAAKAVRSGRPPQAWLLSGPPGIGKATLAYRVARYLLRFGASDAGPDDLSVPANDPVSRQIEAGAHPGLMVLTRTTDDKGKLRSVLGVDEIRKLGSFFGLTSGAGGWRVAIVDSADDMNDNAANALLKVLEEPPARSMLILIAPAPGRLLPTIRSRCQRLDLRPLNEAAMRETLQTLLGDGDDLENLVRLGEGSPGFATRLAESDGLALARDAEALLTGKGGGDIAALFALAERVARAPDGLAHFGEFLTCMLERRIAERAEAGEPGPDRWLEILERMRADYARAQGLHLEPRQTVLGSAFALEALNTAPSRS